MTTNKSNATKRKVSVLLPEEKIECRLRKAFIQNGYRLSTLSARECFHSVFKWNNETSNFWTHIVPCGFLICTYWIYFSEHSISDPLMWPLASYAFMACLLLFTSSFAHTFCAMSPNVLGLQNYGECHSSNMHDWLFLLDYASISMLSVGAGQGFFFYLGASDPKLTLYSSPGCFFAFSLMISNFSTYLTGISNLKTLRYKSIIAVVSYTIPYIFSASPFLYRLYETGIKSNEDIEMTSLFLKQFLVYFIGAVLYGLKIPERLAPGLFDYIGNSHNLMHVCTALGTIQIHYLLLTALGSRTDLPNHDITIWNTLGVVVVCFISNVCVSAFLFLQRCSSKKS